MAVLEVKKYLLGELQAMGFPLARAARALHHTGNTSIEDAVNWIIDHENDPDIDQISLVAVDIDLDSSESFHITEEVKMKTNQLRDRVQKRKEDRGRKMERQKEKERIRSGKELLDVKRIAEENERKRNLDLRRAEKEEENRARGKTLQKLEQDKIERRWKLGLPTERSTAVEPSTNVVRQNESSLRGMSLKKVECMRECLRSLKRYHKDDAAKVRRAFQTLLVYVRNVARNPNDEKFRKIRLTNPLFQDRVGSLKGGIEFLELCGFERIAEEFLYLPRDKVDMAILKSAAHVLNSAMTNPYFGSL